jgi:hypothetical protein
LPHSQTSQALWHYLHLQGTEQLSNRSKRNVIA